LRFLRIKIYFLLSRSFTVSALPHSYFPQKPGVEYAPYQGQEKYDVQQYEKVGGKKIPRVFVGVLYARYFGVHPLVQVFHIEYAAEFFVKQLKMPVVFYFSHTCLYT
jgi:hypothetical protein